MSDDDNVEPALFTERRPGFTTGLGESDFALTVDGPPNLEGSFPLMTFLEDPELLDTLQRQDRAALTLVNEWAATNRWNMLAAGGFLLAREEQTHQLGVTMLEQSASMGNPWAWWYAGDCEYLPIERRRALLDRAIDAGLVSAAEARIQLELKVGNDDEALRYVVISARKGGLNSTRRLSRMVSNIAEAQMLERIAAAQEEAQSEETDDEINSLAFSGSNAEAEGWFSWQTLLSLRGEPEVAAWWSQYGAYEVLPREQGMVSPAFNSDDEGTPLDEDGTYDVVQIEDSALAARVRAIAAKRGLHLNEATSPSGMPSLAGAWAHADGSPERCWQHGHFRRDTNRPGHEVLLWELQAFAYPEFVDFITEMAVGGICGTYLDVALYMAERRNKSALARVDVFDRVHPNLLPRPYVRSASDERVVRIEGPVHDQLLEDCFCGRVIDVGYVIDSDLTDQQLEEVLISVFDGLLLVHHVLLTAEQPGVPTPAELIAPISLGEMLERDPIDPAYRQRVRSAPCLRVRDQLWEWQVNDFGQPFGVNPIVAFGTQARDLLHQAMAAETEEQTRSLMRRAADLGDADSMDNVGFEVEEDGDIAGAVAWYERSAAAGSPNGLNSVGVALTTDEYNPPPDVSPALVLGLCLASALCGNVPAMRNLPRVRLKCLPQGTDRMMLNDAQILFDMAREVELRFGIKAAFPLNLRLAELGWPNALGTVTWACLLGSLPELGVTYADEFDGRMESTRERADGVLVNGWAREVWNARTNAAYMRLAVGGSEADAMGVWEQAAANGVAEAVAGPAFLALRRGDEATARSLVAGWSPQVTASLASVAESLNGTAGIAGQMREVFLKLVQFAGSPSGVPTAAGLPRPTGNSLQPSGTSLGGQLGQPRQMSQQFSRPTETGSQAASHRKEDKEVSVLGGLLILLGLLAICAGVTWALWHWWNPIPALVFAGGFLGWLGWLLFRT